MNKNFFQLADLESVQSNSMHVCRPLFVDLRYEYKVVIVI